MRPEEQEPAQVLHPEEEGDEDGPCLEVSAENGDEAGEPADRLLGGVEVVVAEELLITGTATITSSMITVPDRVTEVEVEMTTTEETLTMTEKIEDTREIT